MKTIMKNSILYFAIFFCFQIHAQVGIGTTTPHESAILDVESTDKGMLIPRLTTAQREAIVPPADGLLMYNTETKTFWYFDGTNWIELKTDFEGWLLEGNAGTDPTTNFLGTTDDQPLNFRVNNIRAGHISKDNVFFGMSSGISVNHNGKNNTAVGHEALKTNINGERNTALGYRTLYTNNDARANDNVAIGYQALYSNTTGNNNVANGYQALLNNTGGSNNIANGYQALHNNIGGSNNIANGPNALFSNTSGNSNVANGVEALYNNTVGGNNVANGFQALYSNIRGGHNVATGSTALYSNTEGNANTAYGSASLQSNTTGNYNVSNGRQSLQNNQTGNGNVAIGYRSLISNIEGRDNVGVGYDALKNNTTGFQNIAIGRGALHSSTGRDNVVVGHGALNYNKEGIHNTALGASADVTDSINRYSYSVIIGNIAKVGANYAIAMGNGAKVESDRSIAIGNAARVHPNSTNSMALGNGAVVHDDNRIRLGNNGVNWIGGNSAWHNTSDARFKYQVENNVPGLEFITKLKPATYYMDNDKLDEFSKTGNIGTAWSDTEGKIRQTGFLAQEVERVAQEIGYEFDGVNKPQNDRDNYTLAYSTFVVPLVKAVQEQQALIESQNARIAELEAQRKELAEVVENQQTQIDSIHQRLDTFFVADKD